MSFASPLVLLSLAALPVLAAGYAWQRRRPGRYSARFPGVPVLAGAVAATAPAKTGTPGKRAL